MEVIVFSKLSFEMRALRNARRVLTYLLDASCDRPAECRRL